MVRRLVGMCCVLLLGVSPIAGASPRCEGAHAGMAVSHTGHSMHQPNATHQRHSKNPCGPHDSGCCAAGSTCDVLAVIAIGSFDAHSSTISTVASAPATSAISAQPLNLEPPPPRA